MHLTNTKATHGIDFWKVDFIGDQGERVTVIVPEGEASQEDSAINRAKAMMVELTAFGTRGGAKSLNKYDAMSNGNFDNGGLPSDPRH
ncbi:hypothetical protein [Rhizobium sp. 11_C7_N12_5]|jgi:hypothetical protein|uniref:hypothetical protein n=1 Tax=Rhizobium sp. 11_C7_N12_5 TaxID=3240770 RepID=UPI003F210DA9